MVLQELHVLRNNVGRSAILLIPPQLVVNLYNICQLVGEIVLRAEEL